MSCVVGGLGNHAAECIMKERNYVILHLFYPQSLDTSPGRHNTAKCSGDTKPG
jgi:hypothetical protein